MIEQSSKARAGLWAWKLINFKIVGIFNLLNSNYSVT